MNKNTQCTPFEAAALWDLHRSGAGDYTGMILVVDLDRADAGICRCERGELPRQQWCSRNGVSEDFFLTLVRDRFPGCADQAVTANLLYGGIANANWIRPQKAYLRSGKAADLPLPSVAVDGSAVTLTCADLDGIYNRHWADATRRALADAKVQLAGTAPRIVPVGRLARLFLAEYLIREAFLEMPLLDDPSLRSCGPGEDPSAAVRDGTELYRSISSKPQVLEHTVMVQTQRRQGDRVQPELLTLARKGTSYEQLAQVTYANKIYLGSDTSLTLFADSQPITVPIPGSAGGTVEPGLGVENEKPVLFLRSGSRIAKIPLDLNEQTGGNRKW